MKFLTLKLLIVRASGMTSVLAFFLMLSVQLSDIIQGITVGMFERPNPIPN